MKLLYVSNSDWNLYLFRLPLARRIREAGYEVAMAAPRGDYAPRIEAEGFRFVSVPMTRSGLNPATEIRTVLRLRNLIQDEEPDAVHCFTAKGVLVGGVAARTAGVGHLVSSITGLGYVFSSRDLRARLLRPVVKRWYREVLTSSDVIFQNRDDLEYCVGAGLVRVAQSHLILSSGVDTDQFAFQPEPDGRPVIMFVGRMLWMKGVREFVDAAQALRGRARFVLVGDTDAGHPSAVPRETLQEWHDRGILEWWGLRDDIPDVLAQCHVYCMPTAGREGVPRGLLEASAVGRSLVATDNRGCREIVRPGENGLLVPVGDARALQRALAKLIENPDLRHAMGRRARQIVETEFSIEHVARQTLAVYDAVTK